MSPLRFFWSALPPILYPHFLFCQEKRGKPFHSDPEVLCKAVSLVQKTSFCILPPGREKERASLPTELQGAAIIRWLQVYGRALAIGGGGKDRSSQHVGFGRRLMDRAEEIARKRGYKKIADISGIGVREYYRNKLGYKLEGTYMVKYL